MEVKTTVVESVVEMVAEIVVLDHIGGKISHTR